VDHRKESNTNTFTRTLKAGNSGKGGKGKGGEYSLAYAKIFSED